MRPLRHPIKVRRNRLLLAPLLVFLMGFTPDDNRPWDRVGTFATDGALQSVDDLTQHCPAPPKEACAYNYPVLHQSCTVKETKELGRFGADQFLAISYLRSITFDEGAERAPYTCTADEIVLAALPGAGRARIVWRDATEREFVFISSTKLYGLPSGERILSILYCMNGTGGCAQGMLIWAGDAWRKLERDESWDLVYRDLPPGYRLHKSPAIDLGNLTWEQHLAHRNDANCCPSGRIYFDLAIIGGKLAVRSHKIVVPEMEATEAAVERLMAREASDLDRSLPIGAFGSWFHDLLPKGTGLFFEPDDCAAQGAGTAPAQGRTPLACLAVEAEIASRDRSLRLLFDGQTLAYLGGAIFSPDLKGVLDVPSLSNLPALLKEAMRIVPLQCGQGTAAKLKREYAGLYEWCEDGHGRRQGPYRSWFSTGIYLMDKGQYEDDGKVGEWIECNRFETCAYKDYTSQPAP